MGKRSLKVLTRNLYLGADLAPVAAAVLSGDQAAAVASATSFWQQVQASDFPLRAKAFASEIAQHKPALVGLQEVSLYRTGSLQDDQPATDVQLDYLQILLDALEQHGADYRAVSVHQAFDGQLPAYLAPDELELAELRLTDRDVILMRDDLPAGSLKLKNSRQGSFASQLDLVTGLDVSRGWTSVDVRVKGKKNVRFVNSHFETDAPEVQKQQADELIGGPLNTKKRTVLVGDFNSDAIDPASPSFSAYESLSEALNDAWLSVKPRARAAKSVTFGRNDDLRQAPYSSDPQRLDLILFSDRLSPRTINRFITPVLSQSPLGPLWNSDHGGLEALIALG